MNGSTAMIRNVFVYDSDNSCFNLAGSRAQLLNSYCYSCDAQGAFISSDFNIVNGNTFDQVGSNGIQTWSGGGDYNVLTNNIVRNGQTIRIDGSANDYTVVCGNMLPAAVSNSGTNTMTDCGNQDY